MKNHSELYNGYVTIIILTASILIYLIGFFGLNYAHPWLMVWGLLAAVLKSFVLKCIVYLILNRKEAGAKAVNDARRKDDKNWKNFVWDLLSFDYVLSKYFKKRAEKARWSRYGRSKLIKQFNIWNVWITVILSIAIMILINANQNNTVLHIMGYFLFFRSLSRSSEIIKAFYNDVVERNTQKRTSLDRTDRITLAVKSYIEMIVLYALLYSMLGQYQIMDEDMGRILQSFSSNIIVSFGTMTLSDSNLTTYFDITSNCFVELGFVKYFMVMQIATGLVLTIFAIAVYLSSPSPSDINNNRKRRSVRSHS